MAFLGRTERRLALAILLTAVIPLIFAIYWAGKLVDHALAQAFNPELGAQLDRSLEVYQELVQTIKSDFRHRAEAMAAHEPLRAAAILAHEPSVEQELDVVFDRFDNLVTLSVVGADGKVLGERHRATPFESQTERKLEVRRPLADGDEPPQLVAVFATPRARFDELEHATEQVRTYKEVQRQGVQATDLYAFAVILGLTIVVATVIGTLLARSVTRRIGDLARATQAVAAGDLTIRVNEQGKDELADLARAFNRMLAEVEGSRARIEFLQRMATWQEMARRLAHEIKNPLTPILLAVEETHRKYDGDDAAYRKLLDTTLEIVEEEVGTLRRLVSEFSSFARLPRAELVPGDLGEFLREQRDRMAALMEDAHDPNGLQLRSDEHPGGLSLQVLVPDDAFPAAFDRQMLRQVLANLVRNAAQASRHRPKPANIVVQLEPDGDGWAIVVDDDGPGIPDAMRTSIFDPYFTTKTDGAGLGLSIVKKIVVEHGGTIEAGTSPLGGARFRVRIPRLDSPAGRAVLEAEEPTKEGLVA